MAKVAIVIADYHFDERRPIIDAFLHELGGIAVDLNPEAGAYDAVFYVIPISTPRFGEKVDKELFIKASRLIRSEKKPFILCMRYAVSADPISDYEAKSGTVHGKPWLVAAAVKQLLHRDKELVWDDSRHFTADAIAAAKEYIGNRSAATSASSSSSSRAAEIAANAESLSLQARSLARLHSQLGTLSEYQSSSSAKSVARAELTAEEVEAEEAAFFRQYPRTNAGLELFVNTPFDPPTAAPSSSSAATKSFARSALAANPDPSYVSVSPDEFARYALPAEADPELSYPWRDDGEFRLVIKPAPQSATFASAPSGRSSSNVDQRRELDLLIREMESLVQRARKTLDRLS